MFQHFMAWILSVMVAFGFGYSVRSGASETDSELKQKITQHMDVITDEMAGIADDLSDAADAKFQEFRQREDVQKVEGVLQDVEEIVNNTVDDIHEHFDPQTEDTEDTVEETVGDETPAEEETQNR